MFDSHAHLNFNTFKEDANEIIKDSLDRNIRIINIGSQYDTSERAVKMAMEYEKGVYASIGIHPIHLSQTEVEEEEIYFKSREERFDRGRYEELLRTPPQPSRNTRDKSPFAKRAGGQGGGSKVVAIGEIGLDYFHIPKGRDFEETKDIQKKGFVDQLKFAKDFNLPVILHCRGAKDDPYGAYGDMIDILREFAVKWGMVRGVIHCFGANYEIAQEFLDLGFYIGFTGIITFKNAGKELIEVAGKTPLDRILVETDCPYLAPIPHRGERCVPQYVEFTLRKVAELKGVSFAEAESQTDKNTEKLFRL